MKNILLFLTTLILCGCTRVPKNWHIPTIPEVAGTVTNQQPPAQADACPPSVIDAPASVLGGETDVAGGPDIRFLIGKASNPGNWKFFGNFAAAHRLYSFDGKNVTGIDGVVVDGITYHYLWQRPIREATPANTNKVVEYKACHRVYFEARQ